MHRNMSMEEGTVVMARVKSIVENLREPSRRTGHWSCCCHYSTVERW
ncbi:hypothetical protein M6B38_265825 [Iris pallida]|uniref:Uncharacterized protein n=1 Tax=Iris pallida TaxID=29817 RepID=A0AAX6IB71_IRIPA|nr:hypothetical protein M6B38_265825 [Iris pallida]